MDLTGTEVKYGMTASANPNGVHVSGGVTIGTPNSTVAYATAPNVAYSLALQVSEDDTLTIDMATGIVTGTVAGSAQVETATITLPGGTITGAGNLSVTVTSAILTGSPIVLSVAISEGSSDYATATQVGIAMVANSVINAAFLPDSNSPFGSVSLTARDNADNDPTLNIAIATGTATGLTDEPTSVNTTAGAGDSMAYKRNGTVWDATDFEGVALPGMSKVYSVMLARPSTDTAGVAVITDGTPGMKVALYPGGVSLTSDPSGLHIWSAEEVTITSLFGDSIIYLDIHAGT